jgi:hypothetical protein
VTDNLKAVEIKLPEELARRLDEATAVDLGFPSTFYRDGWGRWFGDWPTRIDTRVRPLGRGALGLGPAAS